MQASPESAAVIDSWGLGDYSLMEPLLAPAAAALVNAVDRPEMHGGRTALDLAAGRGAVAALLNSIGWSTIATDGSPAMVGKGRRLTDSRIAWRVEDVTRQPLPDNSMDVVASSFGLIFAPNATEAVRETSRVLRPDGRLLFTAWAATGFVAEMTMDMSAFLGAAPRPGPLDWSDEDFVQACLGNHYTDLTFSSLSMTWLFQSAVDGRQKLERGSPTHVAAGRAAGRNATAMMDAVQRRLQVYASRDGTVRAPADYLLVTARRRAA